MIQSIEIKNFKSIKQKYFPLRHLNVLLGLNGQGKSTFIQSMLVLRQSNTASSRVSPGWLDLNGRYAAIGTSRDAFYQYGGKQEMVLDMKLASNLHLNFKYSYEIDKDVLPPASQPETGFDSLIKEAKKHTGLFSGNFQYLSASRINPRSSYKKSPFEVVQNRNLGSSGEYTAHYIDTFHDEAVSFDNLLHPDSIMVDNVTKKTFANRTLINQINLWMGTISPGIAIRTTSVNNEEVLLEYEYKQKAYGYTNRFKPENVGFGITYSLPVITAILSAKPGSLVMIENPESHIHPRGQAELGKLIALLAQNDVQVIIETHSDHIINGIRVAVKDTPTLKDETILFYFEKFDADYEQFSKITNIEIDSNGELSDYPAGLLDEWSNQLLKLI